MELAEIHIPRFRMCYLDPPWRNWALLMIDERHCELEKSIFYHQAAENRNWIMDAREWNTHVRENAEWLDDLVKPNEMPPMIHGPRGPLVVIID